jgi:hypothetical protein
MDFASVVQTNKTNDTIHQDNPTKKRHPNRSIMPAIARQIENLILEILTWNLRCVTVTQFQAILSAHQFPPAAYVRTIRRLAESGEIESLTASISLPSIIQPIFVRSPKQPAPNCDSLAWILEKRWKSVSPHRMTVCWATQKGAHRTAGVACFAQRATQVEHDLGTAAMFTRFCETNPGDISRWVGEDILRRDYTARERWLTKIPDAAIYRNGQVEKVLEFGGQYSAERLRRFDRHCETNHLAYEIW